MISKLYTAIVCCLLLCLGSNSFSQQTGGAGIKKQRLNELSVQYNNLFNTGHQRALLLAKKFGWPVLRKTKKGGIISLQGVNSLGFPVYLTTDNNTTAAATTQTNTVQPGGALGLSLSGSGTVLNDKLAIWDGGSVYRQHQEFAGKTITIEDSTTVIIDHATHVAGTMIARGIYAPAKGMAFDASTLHSYYFDNDVSKMSAAANGLLLSNHSYGDEAGWDFNDNENRWEWYGLPGDTVDYNFGFYGTRTQAWDEIAFNALNYLIVESAGNSHAYPGPAAGSDYYGYQSATNQTLVDKGPRPAGLSSNTGYDAISTTGNAKNILTVGAVNPLPYGPGGASTISIGSFSSWGPTDDGRIKPDIVGDGVDVLSTVSGSPASYAIMSGTSMSAPNVTGSLYLLQEYYQQKTGNFMRAATLKGLACHTAIDAGNAGPDYIYGWGLLNMSAAAAAITSNGTTSLIKEGALQQGQVQSWQVTASGTGQLSALISWTDPAGSATADGTVNSRTPKLVNDLDLRISDSTGTFLPWVLDPGNPSVAAIKGDNVLDNIEQVMVPGAVPGRSYTIKVSHKGTLFAGSQDFSLIATGVGGSAYCTSGPASPADSKINSFTLSNLNYTAPAGCTGYSDHTSQTILLEQGKNYPVTLTLGTCGANFNKAAKVFVDWNGDGIFEAGELAATTTVINSTGTYTGNIMVPASVRPGNYSLLRVVLTETADTSAISACGSYAKGETQDYRVQFLKTSTDAGIAAIISPDTAGSCSAATPITVAVKNYGSAPISNIPVTVTVTDPANTVISFQQVYTGTLTPLEQENFTFNGTFNAVAGLTYHITATTALVDDPIPSNNQASETVTINVAPSVSALSAFYCINSSQYQLSGSRDGELLWYQNANDSIPVAFGANANTSQQPVNNTYYAGLNDFKGTIGPASKSAFTGGGYNQFTPYVTVHTNIPVIIESARLYIGNSGKITFNVANANGEVVSTTTISAAATLSNPKPGVQPDDPNDNGAIYNLNLLLPAPGTYTITPVFDSTATLYRSNNGVTGYPFTLGDVFSIIGNGATSATDTANYKNYYYYFYGMKVKSAGCASAARLPVTVTGPTITQNGTLLSSSASAGNQWYFNDKLVSGAINQTYSPLQSGNYYVTVAQPGGCVLQSDSIAYAVIAKTPGATDIGLVLFPVPASGQLNVVFSAPAAADLTLSLINAAGKIAYTSEESIAAGNFSKVIDVSGIPPGSYVLKLSLGKKTYNSKVVMVR